MSKARHTRQVEVSAETGLPFMRFDPDLLTTPQAFFNMWMIWIHNGHFLGMPDRLVVLATGVILSLLFPTGLYIWFRKRKSRVAVHRGV